MSKLRFFLPAELNIRTSLAGMWTRTRDALDHRARDDISAGRRRTTFGSASASTLAIAPRRDTVAERLPGYMPGTDSPRGDPPYTYECMNCGDRVEARHQPSECADCGGEMQNISITREQ